MKQLIQNGAYTFDASTGEVTLTGYVSVDIENFLLITNVVTGEIVFQFNSAAKGGTVATNVLTLTLDTSAMADTDELQIFYWDDTAVQPVSATSLPLPTGAATETTLLSVVSALGGTLDINIVSGASSGTEYTEGDTDATITGVVAMMEVAANTLQPIQGTVADGLLVNLGANNDVAITSLPAVTAVDLDVRDLAFATDKVDVSGSTVITGGLTDTELRASPVDVDINSMPDVSVDNSTLEDISEETKLAVQAIQSDIESIKNVVDLLEMSFDSYNKAPLYTADINGPILRDPLGAIIPSDAPTVYSYAATPRSGDILFFADTTGYNSMAIQVQSIGSGQSITGSNDGLTWQGIYGLSHSSSLTSPSSNTQTAAAWIFPTLLKYIRITASGTAACSLKITLRQQQFTNFGAWGALNNITYWNANVPPTAGTLASTGSAGSNLGAVVVGSNVAHGSTTVLAPIITGGREAPSDGALGGKTRIFLTDTLGKQIVTGSPGYPTSTPGLNAVLTQDISQVEGTLMVEMLAMLIAEQRITNHYLSELPRNINQIITAPSNNPLNMSFDDLTVIRSDYYQSNIIN